MKSDVDALVAKYGRGNASGYPCAVKASGKTDLIEALLEKKVQFQRIHEIILAEFKIRVPAASIGRHRRGRCLCHQ